MGLGLRFDVVDVKLNERGMYSVLNSERGPVARHIRALGLQTVVVAKSLAGVKTGRLKRSIKMTRDRKVPGQYAVLVGSDLRHALVHHQGASPHVITPKRPGGTLVFRGKRGMVFTTRVNHPGHKGNAYLTNALRTVVRR